MTDQQTHMYKLERKQGGGFLTLEDLASPRAIEKIPINGFDEVKAGDWYEWHRERRFVIARTSGKTEEDTWTIGEYVAQRKKCYVFDYVIPRDPAKPEPQGGRNLCKNFESLRSYNPPPADETLMQDKLLRREVYNWSEVRDNAIFLTNGVYYQKEDGRQARRCDTNELVSIRDINTALNTKNQSFADRREETLVTRNITLTRQKRKSTWGIYALGIGTGVTLALPLYFLLPSGEKRVAPMLTAEIVTVGATPDALQNCLVRERDGQQTVKEYSAKADGFNAQLISCREERQEENRVHEEAVASLQRTNTVLAGSYDELKSGSDTSAALNKRLVSQLDASQVKLEICTLDLGLIAQTQLEVDEARSIARGLQQENSMLSSALQKNINDVNACKESLNAERKISDDVRRLLGECERRTAVVQHTVAPVDTTGLVQLQMELDVSKNALRASEQSLGLCQSPQSRYEFIRERLNAGDTKAVDQLVTSWIRNTCGQGDSRCEARDRFEVEANSAREAGMKLYQAVVGDREWHEGEKDRTIAERFVQALVTNNVFDGATLNQNNSGKYGF